MRTRVVGPDHPIETCPACGDSNTDAHGVCDDVGYMRESWYCVDCDATWDAVYTLTRLEIDE